MLLTIEKLKSLKPNEAFAFGRWKIEHPWFNQATKVVDSNHLTEVNWVAVRWVIPDWTIYTSLGFETEDFLNWTSHLSVPLKTIEELGSKLTKIEDIKRLVPCTEEALEFYRF